MYTYKSAILWIAMAMKDGMEKKAKFTRSSPLHPATPEATTPLLQVRPQGGTKLLRTSSKRFLHPLGMGLDQNFIIKTWGFDPNLCTIFDNQIQSSSETPTGRDVGPLLMLRIGFASEWGALRNGSYL